MSSKKLQLTNARSICAIVDCPRTNGSPIGRHGIPQYHPSIARPTPFRDRSHQLCMLTLLSEPSKEPTSCLPSLVVRALSAEMLATTLVRQPGALAEANAAVGRCWELLPRYCFLCKHAASQVCSSSERLCYNCKQPGHESNGCPHPRTTESMSYVATAILSPH
ncbi:zinc knuckle [Stagonosporopsis vannaccii]|nr:zinc knuckle [Stagonosporopsis vannaccii]